MTTLRQIIALTADIERALHQTWIVTPGSRFRARASARRAGEIAGESPYSVFFRRWEQHQGNGAEQNRMKEDWKRRFLRRTKIQAPSPADVERRFGQYISLGRRAVRRAERRGALEGFGAAQGNADQSVQFLRGKPLDTKMPEFLWVTVYAKKILLVSQAARTFVQHADRDTQALMNMVYIGHRRDTKKKRDQVVVSDARKRPNSTTGLNMATRKLLDAGLRYVDDFDYDEIWTQEVLGRVDHGHGMEASNALDASVLEDLKRIEYIWEFLDGTGPRPFNSKIDNSVLGVTNINGLLGEHNTPIARLDARAVKDRLKKGKKRLEAGWRNYTRLFIKDATRVEPVLPRLHVTKDGIGQTRTAQFSADRRKRLIEQLNRQ